MLQATWQMPTHVFRHCMPHTLIILVLVLVVIILIITTATVTMIVIIIVVYYSVSGHDYCHKLLICVHYASGYSMRPPHD